MSTGSASPLVDATTLAAELDGDRPPVVLDVTFHLGGPSGRLDYETAHVPGAVYVDLEAVFAGPPGAGGRHPLPDATVLQDGLRAAGVRSGSRIVVYDADDALAAARAWWVLRWAGLDDVRVLDGGLAGWRASGLPVATDDVRPEQGDVTVRPGALPVLDADGAAVTARDGVLIDARAAARYRGETEPVDPVAGHIPGAVNVPMPELLTPDKRLRTPGELRETFAAVGADGSDTPVGSSCGSGITAAHTALAMTVAGLPMPAVYVGSWSHWITDPERPVATGDEEPR